MLAISDRGVEVTQWKSEVRLTPVESTGLREAPEVETDHQSGSDKKSCYLSDIVIFFIPELLTHLSCSRNRVKAELCLGRLED